MASNRANPPRRPLALRTQSVDETGTQFALEDDEREGHVRRKSQYNASTALTLNTRRSSRRLSSKGHHGRPNTRGLTGLNAVQESHLDDRLRASTDVLEVLTPPMTPIKSKDSMSSDAGERAPEVKMYDFSRIDYELDRTKAIGQGLWSTVYWAQPIARSPSLFTPLTPPSTPEKPAAPPCSLYAVKLPARPDSHEIFAHEARMLTHLQQSRHSHHSIVPFHGLDPRSHTLVFEAVLGGSLESLVARLKVMTELARHLELRALFPRLALDLTGGLAFLHASGLVHADIKPANVLLDIAEDEPGPTLRARYIDFSASFLPGRQAEDPRLPAAAGTWEFMAPEQLRIQRDLNTPTPASDVWSLGVTLLYVLAGGSPYAAAGAANLFMLREAIKSGDPLGFARGDPVVRKRMLACQDFVDCCRLALQKDRERRVEAEGWERWVDGELFEG